MDIGEVRYGVAGRSVALPEEPPGAEDAARRFFHVVVGLTVGASLVVIIVWPLLLGWNWSRRLVGLAVVIIFVVIANAAVTGILSNVEDRYQSRVIWLVPLLAGVMVLECLDRRYRP